MVGNLQNPLNKGFMGLTDTDIMKSDNQVSFFVIITNMKAQFNTSAKNYQLG